MSSAYTVTAAAGLGTGDGTGMVVLINMRHTAAQAERGVVKTGGPAAEKEMIFSSSDPAGDRYTLYNISCLHTLD